MTAEDLKRARRKLGLSVNQLADVLGVTSLHVRRMETDPSRSSSREIQPATANLIKAYLEGYRPKNWPKV